MCDLSSDVGRSEIYWLGSSSLVSAPFRLLAIATAAFRQTWLKIAATRSAAVSLNSPDFSVPVTG
ncbi:hypothetical protein [Microcoleus sp. F4-D5]|uniref:hypothetical protein n=1 Tax=Microcoleus sp. F4-D5 TaxID=2818760 RepID=UPI002FCF23BA